MQRLNGTTVRCRDEDDWPGDVVLYRLWANSGNGWLLLYVGISNAWHRRLADHNADKDWWFEVERIDLEQHCCRKHALEAEAEAIRTERPVHNVQHRAA